MKEKIKKDIEKNISAIIEGFKPDFNVERMDIYLYTYPAILNHFETFNQQLRGLKGDPSEELIQELSICTLIVYGWMPTIPKKINNLQSKKHNHLSNTLSIEVCKILSDFIIKTDNPDAYNINDADPVELEKIIKYTNGSLVGASKLLHFLLPQKFPIWDSKIYKKITNQNGVSSIKNIKYYIFYMTQLNKFLDNYIVLKMKQELQDFYKENKFNSIEISTVRAAELIIFLDAQVKQ